jgi:hypothetical protein
MLNVVQIAAGTCQPIEAAHHDNVTWLQQLQQPFEGVAALNRLRGLLFAVNALTLA